MFVFRNFERIMPWKPNADAALKFFAEQHHAPPERWVPG
jgi:hypothetical protein